MFILSITEQIHAIMSAMNGREFMRRVRKLGRRTGISVSVTVDKGKGSHVVVGYGRRSTVVKHGEIKKGLLRGMLRQLGIDPKDF